MQLQGKWPPIMDAMVQHVAPVDRKIINTVSRWRASPQKQSVSILHTTVSALAGSILELCKVMDPCSAQVVACLMRSLIEGCAGVFAFCENPEKQAQRFLSYEYVNRYTWMLKRECNPQSRFANQTFFDAEAFRRAKAEVKAQLSQVGEEHLDTRRLGKKVPSEILDAALAKDNPRVFAQNWYGSSPRRVFESEGMKGVGDYLYTVLCSAVHSDVSAHSLFANANKMTPAMFSLMLWGAATLKICESLGITMESSRKSFLRNVCWRGLADEAGS